MFLLVRVTVLHPNLLKMASWPVQDPPPTCHVVIFNEFGGWFLNGLRLRLLIQYFAQHYIDIM